MGEGSKRQAVGDVGRRPWQAAGFFEGKPVVADDDITRPVVTPQSVRTLARECGVTELQIREIISLVGMDRASILREARLLQKDRG